MQSFLAQPSGRISTLFLAVVAFGAAILAFGPKTAEMSILVPLVPMIGVTGFIFGVGYGTAEAPIATLVLLFVLPILCGLYFVLIYYVTGMGPMAGGPLALLGIVSLILAIKGGKKS